MSINFDLDFSIPFFLKLAVILQKNFKNHLLTLTYILFFFRISFPICVLHSAGVSAAQHNSSSKRRILHRRMLHGHASEHHSQRPLHVGNPTVRWLFGHQHTNMVVVDEIPLDGTLRLSEHADHWIWWRATHIVSLINKNPEVYNGKEGKDVKREIFNGKQ